MKSNCFHKAAFESVLFTKRKLMCSHIAEAGVCAEAYLIATSQGLVEVFNAVDKALSSPKGCASVELATPDGESFTLDIICQQSENYLPMPTEQKNKARLLETLDFLEKQGANNKEFEILNAIAGGLIWSESSDTAVRDLGKRIAQEIYDNAMQNAELEAYLTDPDNPSNW